MKKFFSIILICLIITPYTNINAIELYKSNKDIKGNISVYADAKEWRYKIMNGYLYKRLYNISKKKWEGSWIKVYA